MSDKPIWDQLAEIGAQIPPETWAEIEAGRNPGQLIEALRADRDSLRDALENLLRYAESLRPMPEVSEWEWQALESARHVLGSKRA